MTALINRLLPESWAQQLQTFLENRAAKSALRKQNKRIREAKHVFNQSQLKLPLWRLFLEFRVFHDVQGDHVKPDVIHGQSLNLHFCTRRWVEEEEGSVLVDELVCSDDQGRWFELTGNLQQFCWIKRINAQEGAERLSKFNAIQQLAATPFAEAKS